MLKLSLSTWRNKGKTLLHLTDDSSFITPRSVKSGSFGLIRTSKVSPNCMLVPVIHAS